MQIQHSSQFMKARQPRQVGLVVCLMQNLRLRGRPPPIIFARIVRPKMSYNFVADSFHTKKLCSRMSSIEVRFKRHAAVFAICNPFGAVKDNVRCSSWAHRKARSGLPVSVNWTFPARCYGWSATSENRSKIADFAPTRSLSLKISGTRGRPPPIMFAWIVRPMNALQLCRWKFSHKGTF